MPKPVNHFENGSILSDHAYQSTLFEDVTSEEQTTEKIHVGSWNLQDRCVSKATNEQRKIPYANSPYPDYDEPIDKYKTRKEAQIAKIMQAISAGDDFFCLQEVDFLFPSTYKGKKSPEQQAIDNLQEALKQDLLTQLKDKGYDIVFTPRDSDGIQNQRMATIYNTKRFELDKAHSPRGVLETEMGPGRKQHRAFETRFVNKTTNQPLVITNLHLGYGKDYKDSIERYQQSLKGTMHVLYGDCNNVQNEHLSTALGNWHSATNMSRNAEGALSTTHNGSKQKAYDVCMCGPSQGHYVRATSNARSEEVLIDSAGNPKFQQRAPGRGFKSRSLVDDYWQRGANILRRLSNEYQRADTKTQPEILKKIAECIQLKGLSKRTVEKNLDQTTYHVYSATFTPTTPTPAQQPGRSVNPDAIQRQKNVKQGLQEIKNPDLTNLKGLIEQATRQYIAYNKGIAISIFHHHGQAGIKRAEDFNARCQGAQDEKDLKQQLIDFLKNDNNNGNTHPHSYRTMLLNSLLETKPPLDETSKNFTQQMAVLEEQYKTSPEESVTSQQLHH